MDLNATPKLPLTKLLLFYKKVLMTVFALIVLSLGDYLISALFLHITSSGFLMTKFANDLLNIYFMH